MKKRPAIRRADRHLKMLFWSRSWQILLSQIAHALHGLSAGGIVVRTFGSSIIAYEDHAVLTVEEISRHKTPLLTAGAPGVSQAPAARGWQVTKV